MPYIDLIHADDCASIWYQTNTNLGNANSFEPNKPTIAMLHPMLLSSSWFSTQMDDTRLKSSFNMVAFDTRTSGNSVCKFSGSYDSYVQAADLAYCLQYLNLPAVHIFAAETLSVVCALKFAAMFPDMVLSLTLVNVPPPTELETSMHMMDELLQLYCYADDIDTFEHAAKEVADFMAGPGCDVDLLDDLIAFYEKTFPPSRRTLIVQNLNVLLNRIPIPPPMLEAVTAPVLIIQSEGSQLYPLEYAKQLKNQLVNVRPNVVLYVVKDTAGYLTVRNSSIVNKTLHQFLTRQPHARTDLGELSIPIHERMKTALVVLSEFTGDKSFMTKDPMNPLSFSCVTTEVYNSQVETKKTYAKGARDAFSPLRSNGRPIRKYSEGKKDHWFHSEANGLSYADPDALTGTSKGHRPYPLVDAYQSDAHRSMPSSEPITLDVAKDARLRRTNVNLNSTVDKTIIKGSMAKVAASTGVPISKIVL